MVIPENDQGNSGTGNCASASKKSCLSGWRSPIMHDPSDDHDGSPDCRKGDSATYHGPSPF